MPHVTTILGNEVGIQYQGTRDASSLMGAAQVSGLIVGQFKRGRLDQPMTITLENVKGVLGEDPENPDYLAVLDALTGGVPSVQVMRVSNALPLVCTEVSYYRYGFAVHIDSEKELTTDEESRMIEAIFNSFKVYGDGVELQLFKSSNGERNWNVAELILDKEQEYWKLLLILNAGDFYERPFETIRACAVHPIYLQPIPV